MSALDDRRQSAREAAHDETGDMDLGPDVRSAIEAAIETATRVDITPDMIRDARRASYPMTEADMRRLLVDAFRAAGFEVER